MTSGTTIWLRRAALMAVVGVVIGIPLTLLISGGDDEGDSAVGTRAEPELGPAVRDRGLRAGYELPKGWRRERSDGTLRLQARDGSVLVAVAAPAPAGRATEVRDDLLGSIRSTYEDVDVNRGRGRQVGGLDAMGAVVSARQPDGDPIRILVAVASGDERTYVVQVFTAPSAKPNRLRQAQALLNSLRLRG